MKITLPSLGYEWLYYVIAIQLGAALAGTFMGEAIAHNMLHVVDGTSGKAKKSN